MLRRERLGWNHPLANAFVGEDAPNLRRVFSSLQNWIEYPLIGLQDGLASVASGGAATAIPWSVELYDDYDLHDANASTIRVPSQARTYFAVGAFALSFEGNATGRRVLQWFKNGAQTRWSSSLFSTAVSTAYVTAPFLGTVNKGDTLSTRVFQDSGATLDLSLEECWLVFMPMGA